MSGVILLGISDIDDFFLPVLVNSQPDGVDSEAFLRQV